MVLCMLLLRTSSEVRKQVMLLLKVSGPAERDLSAACATSSWWGKRMGWLLSPEPASACPPCGAGQDVAAQLMLTEKEARRSKN
jgi:hypothetical protein